MASPIRPEEAPVCVCVRVCACVCPCIMLPTVPACPHLHEPLETPSLILQESTIGLHKAGHPYLKYILQHILRFSEALLPDHDLSLQERPRMQAR
eukprot:1148348-Pelagomonas_calceolata.AAC.1